MAKSYNFDSDTLFDDITRGRKKEGHDAHDTHDVHNVSNVSDADSKPPVATASVHEATPVRKEPDVSDAHDAHYVSEVHNVRDNSGKSMSEIMLETKGRKGERMKRIHLSCPDYIYDYVTTESRRRGLGRTVFINEIIDHYMKSPEGECHYVFDRR
jgi:hypothetical protein